MTARHAPTTTRRTGGGRRSTARSAGVVVRMSPAERDALHAAAERHGATVTDYVLELVRDAEARLNTGDTRIPSSREAE